MQLFECKANWGKRHQDIVYNHKIRYECELCWAPGSQGQGNFSLTDFSTLFINNKFSNLSKKYSMS